MKFDVIASEFHGALYMKATGDGLNTEERRSLMKEATDYAGQAKDLVFTQLNIVMDHVPGHLASGS